MCHKGGCKQFWKPYPVLFSYTSFLLSLFAIDSVGKRLEYCRESLHIIQIMEKWTYSKGEIPLPYCFP